jgi:hypothetical protein
MATENDIKLDGKLPIERTFTSDVKNGDITGLDQAEIFLRDNDITHDDLTALLEDEEGVKQLVRRVDWTLMPLLCGTCKFNVMHGNLMRAGVDRANSSFAIHR